MQALKSGLSIKQLCRSLHNLNPSLCPKAPLIQNDSRRIVVEPLKRDLIIVRGEEAKSFLQGLVTNDMHHLDGRGPFGALYTLFLNRNGRILYDTIIYNAPEKNSYLIECDREISSELRRYLRQFRVRRKVDIDSERDFDLWVAFSPQNSVHIAEIDQETAVTSDPRLPTLGARIFTQARETFERLSERFVKARKGAVIPADSNFNYRKHRYQYGIGEGISELPPAKSFPLEANADFLNGLSFQKGCYVGQELTARTYHTGVVRKRLMPLRLNKPINENTEDVTTEAGYKVGVLRATCGNYGIALLHVDKVLNVPSLLINGEECHVNKPNWWPDTKNGLRKSAMERVSAEVCA